MTMADLMIVRRQHNAIVTFTSNKGEVWMRDEVVLKDNDSVSISLDTVDEFIETAEAVGLEVTVR